MNDLIISGAKHYDQKIKSCNEAVDFFNKHSNIVFNFDGDEFKLILDREYDRYVFTLYKNIVANYNIDMFKISGSLNWIAFGKISKFVVEILKYGGNTNVETTFVNDFYPHDFEDFINEIAIAWIKYKKEVVNSYRRENKL